MFAGFVTIMILLIVLISLTLASEPDYLFDFMEKMGYTEDWEDEIIPSQMWMIETFLDFPMTEKYQMDETTEDKLIQALDHPLYG